ncbi:MAG: HD domain-containing protein [Flexistipes sinusarabici]|uniref:HD domain-containing protein n=1 Tax=Flexistipes sinusarabici TaxID=2352 RepID=A0A5D0MW92_FLESI|nr:HD domain-containing protein [Flexistipes sinusarabici]TYB36450.1 MAG: HD domain-containing protein [Flexistipes sinusarabici]
MKNGIFATINVGASALRMQISEFIDHKERTLEYLIKPLKLGRDTFSKGYITLENVHNATEILGNFSDKFKEYNIKNNYKAICTSSVRDAENKYFFIDHVRIKTGINLEIIDETDELFIKSLGVKNDIKDFQKMEEKGLLFINLASGNIGINLIRKDLRLFSAALPFGSLRICELFKGVNEDLKYRAYEQYIHKMRHHIETTCRKIDSVKYLVGSGSSINLIIEVMKPPDFSIDKHSIKKLYDKTKRLTTAEIAEQLNINSYYAEILKPTLYVYLSLMDLVKTDVIYFSKQSFPNQLTLYYTKNIKEKNLNRKFISNIKNYALRYETDEKHANQVAKFSKKIFNKLKPLHSLKSKDLLILEAAALLHDVGYFIGINNHQEHSYYIAHAFSMPGFDAETIDIISIIVLLHRDKHHLTFDPRFTSLPIEKKLLIRKLIALLKIADALDASHMQLIRDIDIGTSSDGIILTAKAFKKPFFEEIVFYRKNRDFLEIYGVPINFKLDLLNV